MKGQALVESALVLPVVSLAVLAAVLLAIYCRNAVQLHWLVWNDARRLSAGGQVVPLSWATATMWGRSSPPLAKRNSPLLSPWRPFRKPFLVPVVTEPGRLIHVRRSFRLLPGLGLGRGLAWLDYGADAEAPLEPPLPKED